MKKFLFLTFLAFLSCESSKETDKKIDEALDELNKIIEQSSKDPIGELKKVHQIEYKNIVVELDEENPRVSAAEITQRLNALGTERWSCYHIERSKNTLILFLKRPLATPLRYLYK